MQTNVVRQTVFVPTQLTTKLPTEVAATPITLSSDKLNSPKEKTTPANPKTASVELANDSMLQLPPQLRIPVLGCRYPEDSMLPQPCSVLQAVNKTGSLMNCTQPGCTPYEIEGDHMTWNSAQLIWRMKPRQVQMV